MIPVWGKYAAAPGEWRAFRQAPAQSPLHPLNTTDLLAKIFPAVRRMKADVGRLKAEREEWKQRYGSLKARAELADSARALTYDRDGLATIHNADFLREPRFRAAYAAGVKAAGEDYQWEWRVRVGLWAARHARGLEGDFVECGVQRGFLSRAIMEYLDWAAVPKTFYLLDTYAGLVQEQIRDEEYALGRRAGAEGRYANSFAEVCETFAPFPNVRIVRGAVPGTLTEIASERVAYLSIDMNCVEPEIAAGEYLWPRLVSGGVLLLDDYAYAGYEPQKRAWDEFARAKGFEILELPTGQGIVVK